MKMLSALLLMLLAVQAIAQPVKPRNLVFEGAGIRGIAYAGVMDQLEKSKLLDSVQRVGGTSSGSIIALTIALGYEANKIEDIIGNTNFGDFNDGEWMFIGGLHRIKKKFGWYKGNKLEAWIERIIADKTGNGNITFAEMHAAGYKDLYITATCLNKQKMLVFSNATFPNMKVKDAVRISASIPLYFEAIYIDSTGTILSDPAGRQDAMLVLDGGIKGNFPIGMFDSVTYNNRGEKIRIPNWETIGIRIDSDDQIAQDKLDRELVPIQVFNLKSYMEAFYNYVVENLNRSQLIKEDWDRTISVSCKTIGPKIKQLSPKEKEVLMSSGRESVQEYFAQQLNRTKAR